MKNYLDEELALENYSMKRVFISPGGFLKIYLNELTSGIK
jgi:hypothetical protein